MLAGAAADTEAPIDPGLEYILADDGLLRAAVRADDARGPETPRHAFVLVYRRRAYLYFIIRYLHNRTGWAYCAAGTAPFTVTRLEIEHRGEHAFQPGREGCGLYNMPCTGFCTGLATSTGSVEFYLYQRPRRPDKGGLGAHGRGYALR